MKPLSERMALPIDGPLTKPIMTISQGWYEARVDEVAHLEAELIEERKIVEHYTHKYEDSLAELAEARRKNEKLRDAIEEALEYWGPEWASILRYALKGDDDDMA